MNKNSNTYIIIYSTVMVVIVALILTIAAVSLKPRQEANALNEKKNAILASLSEQGKNYDEEITAFAVDANGDEVEGVEGNSVLNMLQDLKGTMEGDEYPIFQSKDGRFVVPVIGQGLWDVIWGYVAIEPDMNTIAGIIIDHKGETPGLGAEISTAKHQQMYVGKKLFENGEFVSIKLVKGGATEANIEHEVDAITGGTKTSDGVTAMLYNSLSKYLPFFERQIKAAEATATAKQAQAAEATDMSNQIIEQSNE